MQISHPAGNSVAGWKHAILHFLRHHMDATLDALDSTGRFRHIWYVARCSIVSLLSADGGVSQLNLNTETARQTTITLRLHPSMF